MLTSCFLAKAYDSVTTNRKLKKAGREARSQVGNITAQTTESLNAVRLVQSFNNEALETSKMDMVAAKLLAARKNPFLFRSFQHQYGILFQYYESDDYRSRRRFDYAGKKCV